MKRKEERKEGKKNQGSFKDTHSNEIKERREERRKLSKRGRKLMKGNSEVELLLV